MSRSIGDEINDFLRVNQRLRSQGRTYLRPSMTALVSQYANADWDNDLSAYEDKMMETREMVDEVRNTLEKAIDVVNEMLVPIRGALRELKAIDDRYKHNEEFQSGKEEHLDFYAGALEDVTSLRDLNRTLRETLKHMANDLGHIYPEAAAAVRIINYQE